MLSKDGQMEIGIEAAKMLGVCQLHSHEMKWQADATCLLSRKFGASSTRKRRRRPSLQLGRQDFWHGAIQSARLVNI